MTSRRVAPLLVAVVLAACNADPAAQPSSSASPTSAAAAPSTMPATTPPTTATSPTAPTTSGPSIVPVPPPTTHSALVDCLATWPLRERVALLVWPSVYSADWAGAITAVRDHGVGGVILMKPDDAFAAQLATRLGELDAASPHGVLVATDEEGGQVQRLRALGVLPSQEDMSNSDADVVTGILSAHAAVLRDAGVDVVLGPVVDVRPADGSPDPLGQGRLFVGQPEQVAVLGERYVQAWQSAGLLPTLKHFPGHGDANTDTHEALGVTPPLDQLRAWDLVPYAELADSGAAVMVGHLDVPGLTDGVPASRSAAAITLLRDELGWGDALVMTDALGMGGVGLSVPDAAVASLAAGVDVVLFTDTGQTGAVIDAIVAAVERGEFSIDASAVRVARELEARGRPCQPRSP